MTTGQQLYDAVSRHVGERYVLGASVPKDVPKYKGPWDCAELLSYEIFQRTGKLYGCLNNNGKPRGADAYTGYWARDAESIGKIISINQAFKTPGAMLLRKAAKGLSGHIVCSDGHGKTAEAHSTARGVIHSVISGRRWDYGILPPMRDYSVVTAIDDTLVKQVNKKPVGIIYRYADVLMKDPIATGGPIWNIQNKLNSLNYDCGVADGIFGEDTYSALRKFQSQHGLVADGEVGSETWRELFK